MAFISAPLSFTRAASAAEKAAQTMFAPPTGNSLAMNADLLPPGAGFGAPQSIEVYKYLIREVRGKKIGQFRSKMNDNNDFYPHDALRVMATDPDLRRITTYDRVWVGVKGGVSQSVALIDYSGYRDGYAYRDPTDYNYSLEIEYDPRLFVQLLKLHRSAGIETDQFYDTRDYSECPVNDTWKKNPGSVPGTMYPVMSYNPMQWSSLKQFLNYPTDLLKASFFKQGVNIPALAASQHDGYFVDWAEAERYRYVPFGNAIQQAAKIDFFAQVMRFRERVLAYILKETGFMLNTAQLEDQDTLVTLANYFAQAGYAPYYEIDRPMLMNFYNQDGKTPIALNVSTNFQNDMMNVIGTDGASHRMSITNALKAQFESCVWIVLANQDKYYGRIAQLEDWQTVLKSNNIPSFQQDPWRNPFLVFDLAASKEANKPIYKDVAVHAAQKPEEERIVTTDFIPLKHLEMAAQIKEKYLRSIPGAGGSLYAPDVPEKTSNALWIAGAAAAAAGFYFMNR